MSSQRVTLADMAAVAGVDSYQKSWGFYVRAGARVTVDGKVYYFNSDNAGYIYSMPAVPSISVSGSAITLSTESEHAKLYYSLSYHPAVGESCQNNFTEYTGPIEFNRNLTFTAVAVWEQNVNSSGLQNGLATTEMQFIASTAIESFSASEAAMDQYSEEYYIPVIAGEMSQSVDITVPAGSKYMFHYLKTINQDGFNSECEVYVKLQKFVNGAYVTVSDLWYNVPYNEGMWYSDGPFITEGDWRLTFAAIPSSENGKKAIVYLRYRREANADDYSYPRLSGLKVTPKIYGMEIDVNDITVSDQTVDELYTYITVTKGRTIEDITGSATATAADAKAVIKAFLEDNGNYDYVRIWRRTRNSSYNPSIKDIRASDNWIYTDPSENLEADTEYVYMAEIYLKSDWDTWYQNVFDRHGNFGWFRTVISDPLYVLPEDDEAPVITDFYFRQAGDLEVEKISYACTIFTNATDNQRVKSYRLEYKLSSEGDEAYRNISSNSSVAKKVFSYYQTLRYNCTLEAGKEYTFRYTVIDANGNIDVKTFTAVAEDMPAPQDFTVTTDSSSVIITWDPKKDYSFAYDFYAQDGTRIISGSWYDYNNTSAENGRLRYYVDPIKYPTFTIKQYQRATGNYSFDLDYIYKYEQSVGADTE
ncbi:MAG: hypothetical protein J5852_08315, partial [Clostridia bacterium]|nr:hypothetical protein [Clostridia bacterium]